MFSRGILRNPEFYLRRNFYKNVENQNTELSMSTKITFEIITEQMHSIVFMARCIVSLRTTLRATGEAFIK